MSNVSRETQARLDLVVSQVQKWQPHINLISPASLPEIWKRHVDDSLQLMTLAQNARFWLDLGSGGGFPGLVVAAVLADYEGARVTLVESNQKKCAFLRETARIAGLPVEIFALRIDAAAVVLQERRWDVVSARALAPLTLLLEMTSEYIAAGAIGLFPKGRDVDDEILVAERTWNFSSDLIQSMTEPAARIVKVRSVQKRDQF
jgi:16S rRNA (guanine527-N7)-methyltransferase